MYQIPFYSNEWYLGKINDSELAKKSKSLYVTMFKKILRETGCEHIHDVLVNPSRSVNDLIRVDVPTNTQDSVLGTILSILSHSGQKIHNPALSDEWNKEFVKVNTIKQDKSRSNIPSEKQKRCILNWDTVLKTRDRLDYGSMRHLLLSMYTYIPPRRQLDYASMRVYFDPTFEPSMDHNHFHVYSEKHSSAYMFINEYKTKKSYNDFFETEIPTELVEIIISSFKRCPRRYMFVTENKQVFTDANHFQIFSNKLLKDIFNNDAVSVNSLRHSFASRLKTLNNLSVNEHDILSRKMGHSLRKNMEYAFFDDQISVKK